MPQFTNLNLVGMSYVKHPIHLAYLEIKLTMLKLELFVNNNMRLGIIYSWYASIWKVFAIDFYYWQSIFMTIDHVYFSLHWIHIHTLFCLSLENVLTDFDKKKTYVYCICVHNIHSMICCKKIQILLLNVICSQIDRLSN